MTSKYKTHAFTLVEMLIATALTLLVIYGMASAFAVLSGIVSSNRATLELAGQIRGVSLQLQQDLEGITVPLEPWTAETSGLGYFEYREGVLRDVEGTRPDDTHVGDYDDIVMFTSRNTEVPFRGRIQSAYLGNLSNQSTTAEIIWWLRLDDQNGNNVWDSGERFSLHRRSLLVLPELNNSAVTRSATNNLPSYSSFAAAVAGFGQFRQSNDVSVRLEPTSGGNYQIVANSLADLSVRANRFAHVPLVYATGGGQTYPLGGFPSILDLSDGRLGTSYRLTGSRIGEDVVLANCIGFDVKAFDPLVQVRVDAAGIDALLPSDPGYASASSSIGSGAFVDLNYAGTRGLSLFSGPPELRSGLSGMSGKRYLGASRQYTQPSDQVVYDTWSLRYEHDNLNQDIDPTASPPFGSLMNTWTPTPPSGQNVWLLFPEEWLDPFVDESVDGEDNVEFKLPAAAYGTQYGTDDVGERETSPPYPVPLRGLQVQIRLYEPDSRQVRQATVVSDFTPE